MNYTKEEYESYINNADFFECGRERDFALYESKRNLFIVRLMEYYKKYIFSESTMLNSGLDLMETANYCIKSFDPSKGEFLHYFNTALKKRIKKHSAKEKQAEIRGGIHISKSDDAQIRAIIQYKSRKGLKEIDDATIHQIAVHFGKTDEKIRELLYINEDAVKVSNTLKDKEGKTIDIFDTIGSKIAFADKGIIEKDECAEIISNVEDIFSSLQKRENLRKLFSVWITTYLLKAFSDDFDKLQNFIADKEFYCREAVDLYYSEGKLWTKTEMAKISGVSLPSASRTIHRFEEKIKEGVTVIQWKRK